MDEMSGKRDHSLASSRRSMRRSRYFNAFVAHTHSSMHTIAARVRLWERIGD